MIWIGFWDFQFKLTNKALSISFPTWAGVLLRVFRRWMNTEIWIETLKIIRKDGENLLKPMHRKKKNFRRFVFNLLHQTIRIAAFLRLTVIKNNVLNLGMEEKRCSSTSLYDAGFAIWSNDIRGTRFHWRKIGFKICRWNKRRICKVFWGVGYIKTDFVKNTNNVGKKKRPLLSTSM